MQHVTTARDTPSLYVDVSDLLQYLQTHQHPTGIQPVHSEILRRIPGLPGGEAVHFVVLDETQQLQRIVPAALLEVLASLEEPGRAALDARLRALAGQVAPVSLGSGDVFLAIGAFWNVRGMGALFQRLKMAGALIGIYVHDLLSLTEPDDLLHTGVEVEVRPAGRNVRRVSLLSGGERSMAALAFLFAVFRSRPSPFYLMDEVEAALDDVNLNRFLSLVREFRDEAQLLIVSHQKRTMETGDALYGVTMAPGGSSQVVSQKVERQPERQPENEPA